MELKDLVREGRLALGASARALARLVGVSHSYICQIERGAVRKPSPMVLKRLAEALPSVAYWELLRACGYAGPKPGDAAVDAVAEAVLPRDHNRGRAIARKLWEVADEIARLETPQDGGEEQGFSSIPLFTTIPASFGRESGIAVQDYDEVDILRIHRSRLNDDDAAFALRVNGDSMIDAGILEGDLVVVSPRTQCRSGDICVVRVNGGEHSIKKIVYQGDLIILQPCNSAYEPVVVDPKQGDEVFIYGKVIYSERSFR